MKSAATATDGYEGYARTSVVIVVVLQLIVRSRGRAFEEDRWCARRQNTEGISLSSQGKGTFRLGLLHVLEESGADRIAPKKQRSAV